MASVRDYFFRAVLLLGVYSLGFGQSKDPKNPTPLGPGVNKSNIDNMGNGPHYFYFVGGPGKFDLHYAFHEMGMFGNPLRQTLNFDVINETGGLAAHDPVQSFGNLARFTHPGLTDRPKRFVIRVTTQPGAIRLGGYYEIEVTGVATFDGKTFGTGVTPQMSPELIHPGGPLLHPSGPLVQPTGSSTPADGSSTQSGGSLVHPSGPLVQPGGSLIHPSEPLIHPVGALINVQQDAREYRLTLAADILFDFDKATIRPDATEALNRVAEVIRSDSSGITKIEGFTDSKGLPAYNLKLSLARAQSVAQWLVQNEGIPATELSAQGFGASRFAAANTKSDGSDDPEGRQKNRRVELIVRRKS